MTAVSKDRYVNKLNEIVDKCNKKYHRAIKIKSADDQPGIYIDYGIKHNEKDPKLKVGQIFLQRATLQTGLRKSLWSKK